MFAGTIFHFAYFYNSVKKYHDIRTIETNARKGGSSSFSEQLWIIPPYDRSRR